MADRDRKPTVRKRGKTVARPQASQRIDQGGAPASRGTFSPDGSSREPASRSRSADAQRAVQLARKRRRRKVGIAVACVIVLLLGAAGLFAWDRFLRYDDAADIQGQWRVPEQNMTVVIDAEAIHMPASLSYPYQLDTWKKTITYDFAGYEGGGTYEFARDRQSFTVTEGEGESATSVTFVRIGDDLTAEPQLLKAPAASTQESQDAAGSGYANAAGSGSAGTAGSGIGDSANTAGSGAGGSSGAVDASASQS